MASGDTKTESMLNVLGNGGSADEFRGCCNTKTQQYILDAIDRVQDVEDEVEELKNNPDVVDIVDTYADLQAYDTQHLTENDIIRVLQDETHSGNSTYYRFTKNPDTWTFIGEVSAGGDAVKTLTSADFNWNLTLNSATEPYDCVALWLLEPGIYQKTVSSGLPVAVHANPGGIETLGMGTYIVATESVNPETKQILYTTANSSRNWFQQLVTVSNGTSGGTRQFIMDNNVVQTTGDSTTDVMSQNATTKLIYPDITNNPNRIGISNATINSNGCAINGSVAASCDGSVAIGGSRGSIATIGMNGSAIQSVAIGSDAGIGQGSDSISIGSNSYCNSGQIEGRNVAIGFNTYCGDSNHTYSVALGANAKTTRKGEVNVGTGSTTNGYNSTNYRVIGGVHDPVDAHDAATKGYVDSHAGGPTVVQAIGDSTTDVMSQNAVSKAIYDSVDSTGGYRPKIGNGTYVGGLKSMAVGDDARASGSNSVALGGSAAANLNGSIALGYGASASSVGEMNIGTSNTSYGYNNTNYRLIRGVHAPVSDHDAATKGYVDSSIANSMIMQRITNFEYNFDSTDPTNTDPLPENCNSWALWKFPSYGVAFLSYENGLGYDIYIQGGSNPQTISDMMGAEAATAGFTVAAEINGVVNTAIYGVTGQMGPFFTDPSTGEPV